MSGLYGIAGAPGCAGLGDHIGEIFVYKVNTANDLIANIQTLQPSDGVQHDAFGAQVDIDEDYIIGAGGVYGNKGWIFERTNGDVWEQSTRLLPGDGYADYFGSDVAISGIHAIVGASRDNEANPASNYLGAAYIFTRDSGTGSWSKTHKLFASDAAAAAYFGSQVDIYGDWAFIGSEGVSDPEPIYIFKFISNDWVEQQILTPGGGTLSISVDNEYAVIGSKTDGKAYIYTLNAAQTSWTLQQTITGDSTAQFAADVRINGNYIIIGAPEYGSYSLKSGIAYIYKRDTSTDVWSQTKSLLPANMADDDDLGRKVAIYGDYGILGCPGDNLDAYGTDSYHTGAIWKLSGFRDPTAAPTQQPTTKPTSSPTKIPTKLPTKSPSKTPSKSPSANPAASPTAIPSLYPSETPTQNPIKATSDPSEPPSTITLDPSTIPSANPSTNPSVVPSGSPTRFPVTGTSDPSVNPSVVPSGFPTRSPVTTTSDPSSNPSSSPSDAPSATAIVGIPTLCVSDQFALDQVLELKIYLDFDNDLLTIEIFGPDDQWFGVGFGEQMANTYAYIVSGENLDITEHKLAFHKEGVDVQSLKDESNVFSDSTSTEGRRYVSIVRPYVLGNRYDFTDFVNCEQDLSIIWGLGEGLDLSYHGKNGYGIVKFVSCTCPTTTVEVHSEDDAFMVGIEMRPFLVLFELFVVYICLRT
eukprot:522915_1